MDIHVLIFKEQSVPNRWILFLFQLYENKDSKSVKGEGELKNISIGAIMLDTNGTCHAVFWSSNFS